MGPAKEACALSAVMRETPAYLAARVCRLGSVLRHLACPPSAWHLQPLWQGPSHPTWLSPAVWPEQAPLSHTPPAYATMPQSRLTVRHPPRCQNLTTLPCNLELPFTLMPAAQAYTELSQSKKANRHSGNLKSTAACLYQRIANTSSPPGIIIPAVHGVQGGVHPLLDCIDRHGYQQ